MALTLIASSTAPPIGGLLTASFVKNDVNVAVEWGKDNVLQISPDVSIDSNVGITRYLARLATQHQLFGSSLLEQTEVDHWISFAIGPLSCNQEFASSIKYLEQVLGPVTYLVGNKITIADLSVWGTLLCSQNWIKLFESGSSFKNIDRWFNHICSLDEVEAVVSTLPDDVALKTRRDIKNTETKDEGKFVELPGAEIGKVVVRFPPEASGFLHIGHAKAALLNAYYQEAFKGKLIMRFDDTNPDKEKVDFEKVILEDLKLLEIKPDVFTHTSDYFDVIIGFCEELLRSGKAYVDDTDPETMKAQREQRTPSRNRDNPVDRNFNLWLEMLQGSALGQKCCVRAKLDMNSDNGCMRDPTIFRCKNEPHPKTGTKYKVYPTYDFACPIVDSIEGVTHSLRTMEYHDRDEQFYWFIDALGLRKPHIWEFARLNMMNTVLSKRKLTWFVEQGIVDSWEDPRFPTVRGVLRRGLTVEGLKQFIIAQGSSRSVVQMEWDKIWAFNKKVIDPIAPRYTALDAAQTVPVTVENACSEELTVAKHPKNPAVGQKSVWVGPQVLIQQEDVPLLREGENATFINWGNIRINKIHRDSLGLATKIEAETNLTDTDYKKTPKLTWLCPSPTPPCSLDLLYFDHIISKPVLAKDEDFKQYINLDSRKVVKAIGDPELAQLKKGDIIQLQRIGYFKCDAEALSNSPVVLIYIPDGSSKSPSGASATQELSSKEKASAAKGKVSELSPLDETSSATPLNKEELEQIASQWRTDRERLIKQAANLPAASGVAEELSNKIREQGDRVRELKASKADKGTVYTAVKLLLTLKEEFKAAIGLEWQPGESRTPQKAQQPLESADKNAASKKITTTVVETAPADRKFDPAAANLLLHKIQDQGDKVRKLKADKAAKVEVDSAVKDLLSLKSDFKNLTSLEWKPNIPQFPEKPDTNELSLKITEQGNTVRRLKEAKSPKSAVDPEVKKLLELKAEFKAASGQDWKPEMSVPAKTQEAPTQDRNALLGKISAQGDKVRTLKQENAAKDIVTKEVKELLNLKTEFKSVTGQDWTPDLAKAHVQEEKVPSPAKTDPLREEMEAKIAKQGLFVRQLKADKAAKEAVDQGVSELLKLKAEFKGLTGEDWKPAAQPGQAAPAREKKEKSKQKPEKGAKQEKQEQPTKDDDDKSGVKKQTRLGMEAQKESNLPDWYSQVITKAEMLDYHDVSGCYILRPWSFSIWEAIQGFIDKEIKALGVDNCYFPLFVSKAMLEKEKEHIADFSPEVAWVTKSGDTELAEHIAIRPTSETVMYPAYARWIQSHRDLPLKLNQWNNVVRWEFKHPQPFLRTREFLWQEGHTAFADQAEAEEEVLAILDLYARVYTDLLAIPVVKGRKTEKEKFAGGVYTTTVEAFVSASGRAIQGATSHHLGQNFSKMFELVFEDPESQEKKYVFQNSWGITTRTIGVMIMIHADNQGLVLPPRVASVQVVIVPCGITSSLKEAVRSALLGQAQELEAALRLAGLRVKLDSRDNYSPGWKFNHWELKGVPIRVELGPKDLEKQQFIGVRRDTGEKIILPLSRAAHDLQALLNQVQAAMLTRATSDLASHTVRSTDWTGFCTALDKGNVILAPFCGQIPCEDAIKKDSARDQDIEPGAPAMGAKSLCVPFDQPAQIQDGDKCIHPACRNKPVSYTLFGRSY